MVLTNLKAGLIRKRSSSGLMMSRPFSMLRDFFSQLSGGPVWRGGVGDMVLTMYDNGVILDVSPSAAEIIGAAGPLQGRSVYDFMRREDRDGVRACLNAAAEGRGRAKPAELHAEFRLLRVRKSQTPAEILVTPIGRGRLRALIRTGVGRLSPQHVFQRSVKSRPAPMAPPIEKASAPASDRMADLSHEMKTPLNAIMGFADTIRSETFGPLGDPKYKEYAEDIHASGRHLMDLIGSILDSAKIEADTYKLSPVLTDPAPIVRDCAAMIKGEAAKAGLALHVEIAADLPEAMIDKQAVKQILINLLTNAVKFTENGSITLTVKEKNGALDFTVRDTGIGMSQIALAKLGGRFSELHQNGVRGANGAGLGLSLSFALAKLHGGVLVMESAQGAGTTARFTLPIHRSLEELRTGDLSRPGDIQSQLDRVARFRRERADAANAA